MKNIRIYPVTLALLGITSILLVIAVILSGCAGKQAQKGSAVTGEDLGVYLMEGSDGVKTAVNADGLPAEGYTVSGSGDLLLNGRTVVTAENLSRFIAITSVETDGGGTAAELKSADGKTASEEKTVILKLRINPSDSTSKTVYAKSSDTGVMKLNDSGEYEKITADSEGNAELVLTFVNSGKASLTITPYAGDDAETLLKLDYRVTLVKTEYAGDETGTAENADGESQTLVYVDTNADGKPVITKNPESVSIIAGKNTAFVSRATNTVTTLWFATSPDGKTVIECSQLKSTFKTLNVSGYFTDTLVLESVPIELNGWKFQAQHTNSNGTTSSSMAVLTVQSSYTPAYTQTEVHADTGNVVHEHTHLYMEEVIEPTETEMGYTLHYCTCGDSYCSDYVEPLGPAAVHTHTYTADYSVEGQVTYTCTDCGYSYTEIG